MKNFMQKLVAVATFTVVAATATSQSVMASGLIQPSDMRITHDQAVSSNPETPDTLNPRNSESLHIEYCVNDSAYISVGIYSYHSGTNDYELVNMLTKNELVSAGCYTSTWNGSHGDDSAFERSGTLAEEGIYYYGINATESFFKEDTDYVSEWIYVDHAEYTGTCSGFLDVDDDYDYCKAIKWAKEQDIFVGYNDDTFRPNQYINRVEALKVILKAADIHVSKKNREYVPFWDLNSDAWYMPYVSKAMKMGVVDGYPDGAFGPYYTVNKVEALKMLLETGEYEHDLDVPHKRYGSPFLDTPYSYGTAWFIDYVWMAADENLTNDKYYFNPEAGMTRGQMADMLYRYYEKADLDNQAGTPNHIYPLY